MVTTPTSSSAYAALTAGAALVDRSERGKLALLGPDARAALNGVVTNEVETLEPWTGLYAAVLTPKGKMHGDLRVLYTGDELLLDTERVALQAVFDVVRHGLIGFDVQLDKRTLQRGMLSLIGPRADQVCGPDAPAAAEHSSSAATIGGAPVILARTDLGIDVICLTDDLPRVREALLAAGAEETSPDDAEIVRVESGRPRYGVDLDDSVIPQEAGLNDRAVNFTKGCYVGQETVARLFYKGKPNRHLRGLRLSAACDPGAPLMLADKQVGTLTSAAVSPRLGPVGLALVRREAAPGATLAVAGTSVSAEVVELPFEAVVSPPTTARR